MNNLQSEKRAKDFDNKMNFILPLLKSINSPLVPLLSENRYNVEIILWLYN